MSTTTRKVLAFALKVLLSAALVALLTRKVSFADAARHFAHLQWPPTLATILLLGLSLALSAWRWQVASLGRLALRHCLRFTWVAQLYSLILPGALSADVAKGVIMAGHHETRCGAALPASIVLDRVAGLGSLLVFGLLSCLARPDLFRLSHALIVSVTALGALALLALPWIARAVLQRLPFAPLQALADDLNHRAWFVVLALSALIHAVNITFYWTALIAVGGSETWWHMALYTCLLNLAMLLPVSIGGIGLREQIAVGLLHHGDDASTQVAFAWLVLAVSIAHGLAGLLLQWRALPASTEALKPAQQAQA